VSGPVIRLKNLSPEDLFVLLHNIRNVFASGDPAKFLIDEQGVTAFMQHCATRLGADFFLTPRDAVKAFVGLLSVIEQNPGVDWQMLLAGTNIERTLDPEVGPPPVEQTPNAEVGPPFKVEPEKPAPASDDLETFRL
jgi:hypothetical protein